MFPIDPLWAYIGVPVVVVSILVLIKILQAKMDKRVASAFSEVKEEEEVRPPEKEDTEEGSVEIKETRERPDFSMERGSQNCPHYLGYLYMKKAPERTLIPSECYECRKLLQCLYSPSVIEKVYGE